jgi:hypothetical protein
LPFDDGDAAPALSLPAPPLLPPSAAFALAFGFPPWALTTRALEPVSP